jgi:hypothetical protein
MFNILSENDINMYDPRVIAMITYMGNNGVLRNASRIQEVLSGLIVA